MHLKKDADTLRMHLRVKEREKRVGSAHIEDTQRLVTERLKCSELCCSWWQVQAGKK